MTDGDISDLEAAARLFMDPAFVSPNDRQNAEKIILNFRKTKQPYILCRHILEKSNVDMLLFEAADVIKRALIIEWDSLQEQDRMDIRQYLLNYVLQRPLQPYVREKILQVIAIMIKRKSVVDSGQETRTILDEMGKMMGSAPAAQKLLICRVLTAILQEYLITVKSDDNGLTFTEHFKVKKTFEVVHLRKIFEMAFASLDDLLQTLNLEDRVQAHLLHELVTILEQVLMWGYVSPLLPKRLIGLFESITKTDQTPSLRLNSSWEPVMLKPRILDVLFAVYWKVREIPELQRVTLACLVQLSTLNGSVFHSAHARKAYLHSYMTKFLQLLMSAPIKSCEALSVATTFRKMMLYHSNVGLEPDVAQSMLQQMFTLTCSFAENAIREENVGTEESTYNEALEKILEAWLLIHQSRETFPVECIGAYSQQIFMKYVQCHLAAPAGLRTSTEQFDEENDRDKYKEQLIIIGGMARENPKESLPVLCQLLEERTTHLHGHLEDMFKMGNRLNMSITKAMEELFDDIHWLIVIAGHVVTMEAAGEHPTIPSDIVQYSYEMLANGTFDVTTSLKVLATTNQSIAQMPNAENACDGVVRLIAAIFRLCDIENSAIDYKMKDFLSPEVTSDIMWFLTSWAEPYLFMQTEYYTSLSETLRSAFGADTPGGNWTLNFILNKICVNVQNFPTEPSVVKESIGLFVSLVNRRHKCPAVFTSDHFKRIIQLKSLPVQNSELIKGLVMTAGCITDKELQTQYLSELLVPVRDSFNKLEWQQAIETQISTKLVALLEDMRAAHSGATASSAQTVYAIFEPILCHLPQLLDLFHNYNYVVVEIFQVLVSIVDNLTFLRSHKMYDICMGCIQSYVKHNGNRMTASLTNDTTAEDESLEDLLLLLTLLNRLLSKNYFDVDDDDDDQSPQAERATEVCVVGLQYIIGLITLDMLRYPNLCCKYYQTLSFFVDTKSHKLCALQPHLLTSMLQSVELGLRSFGLEVQSHCFDFLQLAGTALRQNESDQVFLYSALMPFLRMVIEMILNQEVSTDNRNECCNALFSLIYCYPDHYPAIVQSVLQSLPNPEHAERLSVEFVALTDRLNLRGSYDRSVQNQFLDRYEKFTVNLSFMHN